VRILGRALVAVGLLVAVLGVRLLQLFTGIAENRTGLDTLGAFLIGLGYTALFAAPGVVVALVGWVLVRRDRPATEERIPQGWGLKSVWVSAVLVAWAGVALSISTTDNAHTDHAEPLKRPSLAQQRADQAAGEAQLRADRVGHPVPDVELRRTERKLEARLRRRHAGARANADCTRIYRWDVSCEIELTGQNGIPATSNVQGQYLPQARMVLFDDQLPGTEP